MFVCIDAEKLFYAFALHQSSIYVIKVSGFYWKSSRNVNISFAVEALQTWTPLQPLLL